MSHGHRSARDFWHFSHDLWQTANEIYTKCYTEIVVDSALTSQCTENGRKAAEKIFLLRIVLFRSQYCSIYRWFSWIKIPLKRKRSRLKREKPKLNSAIYWVFFSPCSKFDLQPHQEFFLSFCDFLFTNQFLIRSVWLSVYYCIYFFLSLSLCVTFAKIRMD